MSLNRQRFCLGILFLGILLRIGVFALLTPHGNDNHYIVVKAIAVAGRIPLSAEAGMTQAYHPPFYYLLALPFYLLGDAKGIQFLSLLLSIATLFVAWRLLQRLAFIPADMKPWLLLLPALHPQFVIYSLLISNDTLAILLGFLIFHQWALLLEQATTRRQITLAVLLGVGLLTKATFLAFILPVALGLLLARIRHGEAPLKAVLTTSAFLLLALLIGSYKFAENLIHEGTPLISGLDYDRPWIASQRPTWVGPMSLFDVNVFKLIARPVIHTSTVHSWSLLLYGTFWYAYIPESSFRSNLTSFNLLGSLIYFVALVPTLLIFAGAFRVVRSLLARQTQSRLPGEREICGLALLTIALNLLLVEHAGWKYDVWSVFQGRLLFPSYFALLLLLCEGWKWARRWKMAELTIRTSFAALFATFIVYYGVETMLSIRYPVDPATHNHMPARLIPDMRE